MRPEVVAFLKLGPLPSESADLAMIERAELALHSILPPLTEDEAEAVLACFGTDDCFGLAWSLVHLIESAPTAFPRVAPSETENAWLSVLYSRHQHAC